jgi:hypothetical protein
MMIKNIKKKHLERLLIFDNINHNKNIFKQKSLKKAHIYCKINKLSGQVYGPLIESYIIKKYNLIKNKSKDCIGDCSKVFNNELSEDEPYWKDNEEQSSNELIKNNLESEDEPYWKDNEEESLKENTLESESSLSMMNFEIKVSLGGMKHSKFNYVQLRMNHNIDYYIFTAYYLSKENIKNKGDLYVFMICKNDLKNIILKYGNYAHGTLNKNGKRSFDTMNNDDKNEYALRPKYGDNCWKELLNFKVSNNNIFENINKSK